MPVSAAAKALDALEAAGKAATPGPLIQDGRFVEVDRDGDFISEHFAQHNIPPGDPVAIAQANAALHVAAVNLSSPLAEVARAAMARPWIIDSDGDGRSHCIACNRVTRRVFDPGEKLFHSERCSFFEIDAALDALEAAAMQGGGE